MKLREILNSPKLNLSFEVFPPKVSDNFDSVADAVRKIAVLNPSFMSVTYGAGGGTSDFTIKLATEIKDKYGVSSLAHLTCVSSTKETVKERISEYIECGIENVLALRGDLLPGMDIEDSSSWDYSHAIDLIHELKESGYDFCIGGACYPEIHPESKSLEDDLFYLKEKVDSGCEFLTTQMFFSNELFYNYLDRVRGIGINVPVIPGIMPITNANQIERALKLSNCTIPKKYLKLVESFGHDSKAMAEAGVAYATNQIVDLYANGITNVHVYSMNKPEIALKIKENLSEIVGKELIL